MANDGATGLQSAREVQPDLIVLDILMPELDGWQVLERLSSEPATADLPVIMLTCKGEDLDILRGLSEGAVEYVTKPFYPENLVASVKIQLDVFDPSEMPAVGTPEPGGLRWPEVIDLLMETARRRKIVGFDVVELSPIPGITAPDFIAAKLIYRFLAAIFTSPLVNAR